MHYYQFNIADYRKDTHHLEPMEHYIYRFLMDSYYLNEKPIPKETQSVLRRLRLGSEHLKYLENVLNDFFVLGVDGWSHKRIDQEIGAYQAQCEKNAKNGKKGGRPKKQQLSEENKPKKTQSVISGNPSKSQKKPNQEPITNNQLKDNVAQVATVIDFLNNLAGTNYKPVENNLKLIRARLNEGYSIQDIENVIKSKCAEWLGTKDEKYLRPATLFGAEKFNNYFGQVGKGYKNESNNLDSLRDDELLGMADVLGIHHHGMYRKELIKAIEARQ